MYTNTWSLGQVHGTKVHQSYDELVRQRRLLNCNGYFDSLATYAADMGEQSPC